MFAQYNKVYWIAHSSSGIITYYLSKEKMLKTAKALNDIGYMDHYKMYELETEFNDEILLALLNEKFTHSMFHNYEDAKRITYTE
jgi:hypothetical protein